MYPWSIVKNKFIMPIIMSGNSNINISAIEDASPKYLELFNFLLYPTNVIISNTICDMTRRILHRDVKFSFSIVYKYILDNIVSTKIIDVNTVANFINFGSS